MSLRVEPFTCSKIRNIPVTPWQPPRHITATSPLYCGRMTHTKTHPPEPVSLLSLVRLHERTDRRDWKREAERPADGTAFRSILVALYEASPS